MPEKKKKNRGGALRVDSNGMEWWPDGAIIIIIAARRRFHKWVSFSVLHRLRRSLLVVGCCRPGLDEWVVGGLVGGLVGSALARFGRRSCCRWFC